MTSLPLIGIMEKFYLSTGVEYVRVSLYTIYFNQSDTSIVGLCAFEVPAILHVHQQNKARILMKLAPPANSNPAREIVLLSLSSQVYRFSL